MPIEHTTEGTEAFYRQMQSLAESLGICGICGGEGAHRHSCNGDGRYHHDGYVHAHKLLGGGRVRMCDDCFAEDRALWGVRPWEKETPSLYYVEDLA